jgi:hypothetical protein
MIFFKKALSDYQITPIQYEPICCDGDAYKCYLITRKSFSISQRIKRFFKDDPIKRDELEITTYIYE